MQTIGLDSYESPHKVTWRGTIHNAIAARLSQNDDGTSCKSPRRVRDILATKTIVYLAGPNDRDREAAIKRGFLSENLFAVDLNQRNVNSVRARGGLAICDSIENALINWREDLPIDCVILDYCCGFEKDIYHLPKTLLSSRGMYSKTVIIVNLQRGRDSWHTQVDCTEKAADICGQTGRPENYRLHRGFAAAVNHATTFAYESFAKTWSEMNPKFFAYPSDRTKSNLWMDSCLFSHFAVGPHDSTLTQNARDEQLLRAKRIANEFRKRGGLRSESFAREMDEIAADIELRTLAAASETPSRGHKYTYDLARIVKKHLSKRAANAKSNTAGKMAALRAVRTTKLKAKE